MITSHQSNTLNDIYSAVAFFRSEGSRDDLTLAEVVEHAGMPYATFYHVLVALKRNGQLLPLQKLHKRLKEIGVTNVKHLKDLPDYDDTVTEQPEPAVRRSSSAPVVSSLRDRLAAHNTIVEALENLSRADQEAVLLSAGDLIGMGKL